MPPSIAPLFATSRSLGRLLFLSAACVSVARGQADATRRVASRLDGSPPQLAVQRAAISADGAWVAFDSGDRELIAGDDAPWIDIFLWERATGAVVRVSVNSAGEPADNHSSWPAVSGDGTVVAFASRAKNLSGAINNDETIFVRDLVAGTTTNCCKPYSGSGPNGASHQPSVSADGSRVAFASFANNLVPGRGSNFGEIAYVYDRATDTVLCASDAPDGTVYLLGYDDDDRPRLSADGRFVAFAGVLHLSPFQGIFRKDLETGELLRLDHAEDGSSADTGLCLGISDDGNFVLFSTPTELVPEDRNGATDLYLRDVAAGTLERVSVASGGVELSEPSHKGTLAGDGRHVLFSHIGSELIEADSSAGDDLFIHDRVLHSTIQVTRGTLDEQTAVLCTSLGTGSISRDGGAIVFTSTTRDFTDDDLADVQDVYLRERAMVDARTSGYGTGFPGRNGIPAFTVRSEPARGTTFAVDIENSAGIYTVAFLLIGIEPIDVPTSLLGHLLVDPMAVAPIGLAPDRGTFSAEIPDVHDWLGAVAYLQALELDPWAARGVSFTPGLEVVIGDL